MAATRKLQGEIERCLKKVTEGVETFEDIWMKVSHAANSNQKEKYEADLKKEIKKLQRLRDQIKTWQASAEVKDKSSLVDHRKLIETQMERFKGLERETKTKAYSKEGLGAAVKLDPVQKERDDCTRWLSNNIEQLNVQIDQFEAELDGLAAKKKRDRDKAERLESLKHWIERHRYHIKKLETLLRMLDNNAVDTDVVKKIRDDVEYYTESNQEPEFEENEYIYCDINMDNLEEVFINDVGMVDARGDDQSETTNSLHSGSSPSPLNNTGGACSSVSGGGTSAATTPSNSHHQHHSSASSTAAAASSTAASSAGSGDSNHHHNHHHGTADDSKRTRRSISEDSTTQKSKHPSKSSLQSSKTPVGSTSCLSGSSALSSRSQSAPTAAAPSSDQTSVPSLSAGAGGAPNFAAVAAATSLSASSASSAHHPVHILTTSCSSASSMSLIASTLSSSAASSSAASAASSGHQHLSSAVQSAGSLAHLLHPLPSPAPPALSATTLSTASSVSAAPTVSSASHQHQLANSVSRLLHQVNGDKSLDAMTIKSLTQQTSSADHRNALSVSPVESNKPAATNEAHIPTLYSVAPLGPVPITKDHDYQFQMLQAAFYHMPHPSDSERLRTYLPRNPYPTPPYHPQVPPPGSDSFEFFMKLSVETLFFIFYYMEGTKAQYLAAKSLKKQSWRFHTKYMMWFQRHEEPKLITDEFEQGTYIYFDFEKWSQRKKEGFKFEYKFLEDRDLN